MTRRSMDLPTVEDDRVGRKVTLTVEAYISKIEADLIECGSPEDPGAALPGESWTTFEIARVIAQVAQ